MYSVYAFSKADGGLQTVFIKPCRTAASFLKPPGQHTFLSDFQAVLENPVGIVAGSFREDGFSYHTALEIC
jgi:hypothetical protein